MRVLQVDYNYMQQEILFDVPKKSYSIATCAPKSAEVIRSQMKTLKVDNTGPTGSGVGAVNRKNCDLCVILGGDQGLERCITEDGRNVCNSCKTFGYPACPWTSGLKTPLFVKTPQEQLIHDTVVAAIFATPEADMSTKTFRQTFASLIRNGDIAALAEDSEDSRADSDSDGSNYESSDDDEY
ncbi:hypothetical protein OPT61_g8239 [Boeremia exigua]|uniref:Uncharacterized protein n=1 Tax=Boeremia exigua TaxID=749465 RepID=A0ACC2I0Q7_9PLEO|nr:hypothetical protein OPT61_g8239 [Boeremia exigua]